MDAGDGMGATVGIGEGPTIVAGVDLTSGPAARQAASISAPGNNRAVRMIDRFIALLYLRWPWLSKTRLARFLRTYLGCERGSGRVTIALGSKRRLCLRVLHTG